MTKSYTHGPKVDEIARRSDYQDATRSDYYYHYDGLGSVTQITDHTGVKLVDYSYDVFGELRRQNGYEAGNTYLFCGKLWDNEIELYYNRARMYAPRYGRFTTKDTREYDGYDPFSLHKYLYANANPINLTDPTGMWVALGARQVKDTKGYHTVIIIRPDNPSDFENDPNISSRLYKNSKGELELTLSANPNWKPNWRSLCGNLVATPNVPGDRPEDMVYIEPISDPLERSDTELIKDILTSADAYEDDLPYDPTPVLKTGKYNSNSYTYGILKNAGISEPPNLEPWEPGADVPIPLPIREDIRKKEKEKRKR